MYWSIEGELQWVSAEHIFRSNLGEVAAYTGHVPEKVSQRC